MTKKMVKNLMLVLTMVVLCFAVSVTASAEDRIVVDSGECGAQGDNVIWTLYDDGELVISGKGEMEDYAGSDGYSSWYSSAPWRRKSDNIKSATVENGVTTIGGQAFGHLGNLYNVNLPESLEKIGYNAFYNCDNIETINIPKNVYVINEYAFDSCEKLNAIIVHIGNNYFCDEDGILFNKEKTKIVKYPANKENIFYAVPVTVTTIGVNAFAEVRGLIEISLPETATRIDKYAFAYCEKLNKINLPAGIEIIEIAAFEYCISLTNIEIPDTVETIDEYAFYGCSSLKEIAFPDNTTAVGVMAFAECASLEKIVFGEKINAVSAETFAGCINLEEIYFGANIRKIGLGAFLACFSLKKIDISSDNPYLMFDGDAIFNNDKTELIYYVGDSKTYEYEIPDCVTKIRKGAFIGNATLKRVIIPETVSTISFYSFGECSSLEEVVIPDSVTKIESYAFSGSSLKQISLPDSTMEILDFAFRFCSNLEEISFSRNIALIGDRAFEGTAWYDNQKEGLVYLNNWVVGYKEPYQPVNEIRIAEGTVGICNEFLSNSNVKSVYIPESVIYIPKAFIAFNLYLENIAVDSNNKYFLSENGILYNKNKTEIICFPPAKTDVKFEIPYGIENVRDNAFAYCQNIEEIILPNTLKEIGSQAFAGCHQLKEIAIPDGVTFIGGKAFEGCLSLSNIAMTNSVKKMGLFAFENTAWYRNQPDGIIYIGNILYDYKGIITEEDIVEIREDTVCIAGGAFIYQNKLRSIYIPDSVEYIGEGAFGLATNLKEVYISKNLKEVAIGAFSYSSGITDVYYRGTKEDWDKINFSDEILEDEFMDECLLFFDEKNAGHLHSAAEVEIIDDSTCILEGTSKNICKCGFVYLETLPLSDHNFGEWIAEENKKTRECKMCKFKEIIFSSNNGDVKIETPETPDTDFTVDVITDYVIIEETIANNVAGDFEVVKAFDITLKNKDGVHVQPDGTVKVKLPLHSAKDGVYKVYRVNDDGTLTDMKAYRQGSHMVFETDHFSIYVIVDESVQDEADKESQGNFFTKIIDWFKSLFDLILSIFK